MNCQLPEICFSAACELLGLSSLVDGTCHSELVLIGFELLFFVDSTCLIELGYALLLHILTASIVTILFQLKPHKLSDLKNYMI